MKNISLLPLIIAAIIFSSELTHSQVVSASHNGKEITVTKDTTAQFTVFTGRYVEGKTYLHWKIANQHISGVYIVYRSIDGINYEMLGQKQGIGVPISVPIAYYFQDENPPVGTTYYKLVHFSRDNTYLVSKKIAVTVEGKTLSQVK